MDKIPPRGQRDSNFIADLYALITYHRKSLADTLVPPIPVSADDVTRIRGWVCFLTAVSLLYRSLFFAFVLLLLALILDSVDGAVARKQGLDCPQTDRAMDLFTGWMLCAAYLTSYPSKISVGLMFLWFVPKVVWLMRLLKRFIKSELIFSKIVLCRYIASLLVALQFFPFSHTLLILIFMQWVFKWRLP